MEQTFKKSTIRGDWLLLSSAIFTWSLVSFLMLNHLDNWGDIVIRAALLVLFLVLFLSLTTLKVDYSRSQLYTVIAIQIVLVQWLISKDHSDVAAILLVLIATQLPAYFRKKYAISLLVVINITYYLVLTFTHSNDGVFQVLIFFFLQIFGFSTIDIMIREQKAKEQVSAINQELMATRHMLKASSKRQERLRISRDLHDVLGHQLTALSLNLEVTMHKVPEEYKELLEQNLLQAKSLLNDVRDVVKEMRLEDQLELTDVIQSLFDELPDCQITIGTLPTIHSLLLKQQLVYCLQEGVSNGLRHGRANQFDFSGYTESGTNTLVLVLSNNGILPSNIEQGSGLKGMNERLAEFNGQAKLDINNNVCTLIIMAEDNYD